MGIFGEFRVELPKKNLRNMKTGTAGYIFSTDFVISKSMLCIPFNTEVFYNIEDVIEADRDCYVAIYKLEDGLSHRCFDIDLNEDPSFNIEEWYPVPSLITKQYSTSEDWICFPNPPIFFDEVSYEEDKYANTLEIDSDIEKMEKVLEPLRISQLDVKELRKRMKKAVANEAYEEAAKFRDELNKRKEKGMN